MEKVLLEFEALHSALGSITTNVQMFEDRIVLKRRLTGVLAVNVSLPAETTVYYKDVQSIGLTEPGGFLSAGVGWIEVVGPVRSGNGVVATVNVSGNGARNVETVGAMNNPYCIVYSKNKNDMPRYYTKMKKIFEEYGPKCKKQDAPVSTVTNIIQNETALDKIQKLKTLLDMGAISQGEYDEKKAKLLKEI